MSHLGNTSWDSKGVTLLEFGADGKLAFGFTEVKYSVKKRRRKLYSNI